MDRTELINKMHQTQGVRLDVGKGSQTYILKDDAVKLVQGLRELAPLPEKVCIPHFVAEYIKKCKEEDDISLYMAIRRGCSGSPGYPIDTRVGRWFMTGGDAYVEKFARAWVSGYTVEEEQKYIVKLPLPGNETNDFAVVDIYGDIWIDDEWPSQCKMTEKEIKALPKGEVYFEHFAVKAEEME